MKRTYHKMTAVPFDFELESAILAGSQTLTCIKVQDVVVEAYTQGFGTDETDDFQNVSFD